jgi:hypothetical protein
MAGRLPFEIDSGLGVSRPPANLRAFDRFLAR